MVPLLLICIPVVSGLLTFLLKNGSAAKNTALFASIATLAVGLYAVFTKQEFNYDAQWLPVLGSSFSLHLDGMAKMLALLTTISFPVVFAATYNNDYKNANAFYGLMLLTQAGLLGVFLASDCLLFYFFWELALIPVYFLCSIWGGEKRIAVTFKFFVYTFIGSLLMLVGILYLYNLTPDHSFAIQSFYALKLTATQQNLGFWLFFIAFAIKMPIFPLHTWQPDAYEQSPTSVTMILSGVMVKMGIYAVIRWLVPVFPLATEKFGFVIILLSVIGMLYASFIAIKQDDIKRLIAYSSIGHIGLMCAAIFAMKSIGLQGVMIQMFSHGINVIGLWIVADAIEQQLGTRKFSDLGGLAQKAPVLAILLVVMAFANIALPLTNAFVGEFLMFNGLFQYNIWIAGVAGISIILAAVYTLNMVQKIFYGNTTPTTENAVDINGNIQLMLIVLVVVIIGFGVYPQPMIELTKVAAP
jgi:NADH-quinone oxidoreductase subunit M